ncbi:MAG: dUTP diphosphatase [Oscillospiraceae bacterium]|jgi:dUTP pyrophosphatase|nr:dUTP diphosphatase [Oscillospiraceae bacterium]
MEQVKVKLLHPNAKMPVYGTEFSAGADLCACLEEAVTLQPGQTHMISIGIAMEIPVGYAALVYARSGLASKRGLAPANKVGVVDCDYRGEFFVPLHNHSAEPQTIFPGDRIAQMIITPYLTANFVEATELTQTVRGNGGFGSTGVK